MISILQTKMALSAIGGIVGIGLIIGTSMVVSRDATIKNQDELIRTLMEKVSTTESQKNECEFNLDSQNNLILSINREGEIRSEAARIKRAQLESEIKDRNEQLSFLKTERPSGTDPCVLAETLIDRYMEFRDNER